MFSTPNLFVGGLSWGRCTKKVDDNGATLYLHVFDKPQNDILLISGLKSNITQAYMLDGSQNVKIDTVDKGVRIYLPKNLQISKAMAKSVRKRLRLFIAMDGRWTYLIFFFVDF